MGVDLHLFIEVDYSTTKAVPFSTPDDVRAFNRGEFFIWRNPELFDAMGYRPPAANGTEGKAGETAKWPPPNLTSDVFHRYYHVVEEPSYEDESGDDPSWATLSLPPVDEKTAKEWVAHGWSHYAAPTLNAFGRRARARISDPAWHSANWMLLKEFVDSIGNAMRDCPTEVQAIIAVMQVLESSLGEGHTRIVFWFDN